MSDNLTVGATGPNDPDEPRATGAANGSGAATAAGGTGGAAAEKPRRHRARRSISWVLVVLASILVPLSAVTVWAVYTITNTDRYVATLAPLARERVVTDYIAAQGTNKLFHELQVQTKVKDALPPKAGIVAAPITNTVEQFTREQMSAVLASTWFHNLWDRVNRRSHTDVINFLKGEKNPRVEKAQQVVADVTPVLDKAINKLDQRGVTIFDPVKRRLASGHLVTVPLATKQQVAKIQSSFNLATKIGYALPFVALFLILAAVGVAIDRRKALLRCAIGASIGVLVLLTGLQLGRTFTLNRTEKRVPRQVTATVFDTFLRYLQHSLRIILLVALLVAIVMWFIGPSSWARGLRGGIARAARWVRRQFAAVNTPEHRDAVGRRARSTAGWCLDHAAGLRIAGVVVAGIVIVFGGNLSPSGVLWTLVVLAIYLLLLQVLFAWARRARAAPPPADAVTGQGPAQPAPTGTPEDAAAGTEHPATG